MAESQNSTSSSSDKDSLLSTDKNTVTTVPSCGSKGTETDFASVDDEDFVTGHVNRTRDEHEPINHPVQMVNQSHQNEQRFNAESKQPKTIKNIMMALKEGKVRESSPMRGNRSKGVGISTPKTTTETVSKIPKLCPMVPGLKSYPDTPPLVPSKPTTESAKRIHASPLRHQVF